MNQVKGEYETLPFQIIAHYLKPKFPKHRNWNYTRSSSRKPCLIFLSQTEIMKNV